jgi:hypothetical protein
VQLTVAAIRFVAIPIIAIMRNVIAIRFVSV